MIGAQAFQSGKTRRDENFPVASRLVEPQHRAPILAFYDFVRTADDVADNPTLQPGQKLALLSRLELGLLGQNNDEPDAVALRQVLAERGLPARHAQELLKAFRLDISKHRYETFDELMRYCRYSAMPVGRFVLDVHGEDKVTWPASDALCAALQILNHMQDCQADYRALDRVYLPEDMLRKHGASVEQLALTNVPASLRRALDELCDRVSGLLQTAARLPAQVQDWRLRLEISVIHSIALRLLRKLREQDPLAGRIGLDAMDFALLTPLGVARGMWHGLQSKRPLALFGHETAPPSEAEQNAAAAGHSSFSAAMRIMPARQRKAMFDVYGFCRAVDDIADEAGDRTARLARLAQWRDDIAALYRGSPPAQLAGLAETVEAFGLDESDFLCVIDGMEMDAKEDIRAPDLDTLDLYCERVASAVGRLCTPIFGMAREPGTKLAHHLGRALQLTNILRDLDEDAAIGRLYLPRELLAEDGIASSDPDEVLAHPALERVCTALAGMARGHFGEARAIMAGEPRSTVRPPLLMADAYGSILGELEARGWHAPRQAVRLGRGKVARMVVRSFLW